MREYHEQVKYCCSFKPLFFPCSRFIGKNKGHYISISEKHMCLEPRPGWPLAPSLSFAKKTSVDTRAVLSKTWFQGRRKMGFLPWPAPLCSICPAVSSPTLSPPGLSICCSAPILDYSPCPGLTKCLSLLMERNLVLPPSLLATPAPSSLFSPWYVTNHNIQLNKTNEKSSVSRATCIENNGRGS